MYLAEELIVLDRILNENTKGFNPLFFILWCVW